MKLVREQRRTYRVLEAKKTEENTPSGRTISRWVNNIKIYFKELGCKGVNRNHVAQGTWQIHLESVRTFGFHKIRGSS
jgi:hypothetical protein